jgi:hypothetical protein
MDKQDLINNIAKELANKSASAVEEFHNRICHRVHYTGDGWEYELPAEVRETIDGSGD